MIFYMAIVAAAFMSAANFAYALTPQRRRSKRPFRLFAGCVGVYFMAVYGMALMRVDFYALKAGWLTVGGVTMLCLMLAAEAIIDWRRV